MSPLTTLSPRTLHLVALTTACVAFAGSASAQPVPAQTSMKVKVGAIDPTGALVPAAEAEVVIERVQNPRPGDPSPPELVMAWTARADVDGLATLPPLPPRATAENDRVRVRYAGVETVVSPQSPTDGMATPLQVFVRRATRDTSRLTMSMVVSLTARDTGIQVEHLYIVQNPTHELIDTDTGEGLILPLVAPAPFGVPIEGFLPPRPEPNEFVMRQTDERARTLVESGRLVYRGQVDPDARTSISVTYVIPYDGVTEHVLGFHVPVDLKALTFVTRTPPDLAMAAAPRLRTTSVARVNDGSDERIQSALEAPRAGTDVLIDVTGTPDRHAFYRPLASFLGLGVIFLLVVLVGVGRNRAGATDARPAAGLGR